jgi:hypothetical protein
VAKTAKQADFGAAIARAYTAGGKALQLGRGVHEGELSQEAVVQVPCTRGSWRRRRA